MTIDDESEDIHELDVLEHIEYKHTLTYNQLRLTNDQKKVCFVDVDHDDQIDHTMKLVGKTVFTEDYDQEDGDKKVDTKR